MPGVIVQSLKVTNKQIETAYANAANAVSPDSIKTKGVVGQEAIGNQLLPVFSGVQTCLDDFTERTFRNRISSRNASQTTTNWFNQMANAVGAESTEMTIDTELTELKRSFADLMPGDINSQTMGIKSQIVTRLNSLTESINVLSQKWYDIIQRVDSEVNRSLLEINQGCKEAYDAKKRIDSLPKNQKESILGPYYKAAEDISQFVETSQNSAEELTTINGKPLITKRSYAEFSYEKIHNIEDIVKSGEKNAIKVRYLSSDGSVLTEYTPILAANAQQYSNSKYTLGTGKITSLIELRDKIIPEKIAKLDELARVMNFNINSMAGASNFSSIETAALDLDKERIFTGKISATAVTKNNQKIIEEENYILPLELDLGKLRSNNNGIDGHVNIETIRAELDNYFETSQLQNSVKFGETKNTEDKTTGHIVSNFNLVANTDIQEDNSITFDFDVGSSSLASESHLQIIAVKVNDENITTKDGLELKGPEKLARGKTTRTNRSLTIPDITHNINNDEANTRLELKIRVTDSDGNCDTKNVYFTIHNVSGDNRNSQTLNKRYFPVEPENMQENTDAKIFRKNLPVGSAMTIHRQDGNHIQFESSRPESYNLVLQNDNSIDEETNMNLFQLMEITPMLQTTEDNSAANIKVSPLLLESPELLPTFLIKESSILTNKVNVGDKSASLKMEFKHLNYQPPEENNTITISVDGIETVYTFVAHPNNNTNQIEIKNNLNEQIKTIVDTINNPTIHNASSQSLVTAKAYDSEIIFTSKIKGELMNDKIQVLFDFTATQARLNSRNEYNNNGYAALIGGESKNLNQQQSLPGDISTVSGASKLGSFGVTETPLVPMKDMQLSNGSRTLASYVKLTIGRIITQSIQYQNIHKAEEDNYEQSLRERQEKAGVNPEEIGNDISNLSYLQKMLTKILTLKHQLDDYMLNLL